MSGPDGDMFDEKQWRGVLAEIPSLSHRQEEISKLILKGLSDKQIASRIGISIGTVRTHLGRLFGKLDVQDRTELALHLMRGFLAGCHKVRCPRF
jgi:DNA-binding CsgD family transcriptional regulator